MLKKSLAAITLTLSLGANAALVDMGTYIRDDVGMVDYLKLYITEGYSWNDVVRDDDLGYIADGWSVTSQAALVALDASDPWAYDELLYVHGSIEWVATDNNMNGGQYNLSQYVQVDRWLAFLDYQTNVTDELASNTGDYSVSLSREVAPVPIPAAVWLFGSALLGLAGIKRRRAYAKD